MCLILLRWAADVSPRVTFTVFPLSLSFLHELTITRAGAVRTTPSQAPAKDRVLCTLLPPRGRKWY